MPRHTPPPKVNPRRRSPNWKVPAWTPCGYCFGRWATVWDHLQPWSKGGPTTRENLYPSCARCNALLGALAFTSIQEKREYVRTTLIERNQWNPSLEDQTSLPDLPRALSEDTETPAVLQRGMQKEGLEDRPEEHGDLPNMPNRVRSKTPAARVLQSEMPVGRVAKPKSGKPAPVKTDRSCRRCLKKFAPRHKHQLFCDKVCQNLKGKENLRLETRLENLAMGHYRLIREYVDKEISRQLKAFAQSNAARYPNR